MMKSHVEGAGGGLDNLFISMGDPSYAHFTNISLESFPLNIGLDIVTDQAWIRLSERNVTGQKLYSSNLSQIK
jgi:hypothetical protein